MAFDRNNVKAAVRILRDASNNTFSIAWLRGDAMRHKRQAILETLTGEKWTVSKSGIGNVESKLFEAAGIDAGSDCYATRVKRLADWSRDIDAATEDPPQG